MDTGDWVKVGLLLIAMLVSAIFSASEAAFLSLHGGKLAYLKKSDPKKYKAVYRLAGHPERLLPTVLTGNNLSNTAAAALGTGIALSFFDPNSAVAISTIGITILLLIFSEIIPKTLATRHSVGLSIVMAAPLKLLEMAFLPLVWSLGKLVQVVARVFGVQDASIVSEGEIRALIDVGREHGSLELGDAQLIENVFRFGDLQLREMMTPRTEIVSLEKGDTLRHFMEIYSKYSHTRFPVYQGTVDNVLGTVSVKDVVLSLALNNLGMNDDVTQLLRPAHFVPESKLIGGLFREVRGSGYQMVIVADEYGGVAGLVTLKQMVEEIVGRVGEEGVEDVGDFRSIDYNTYQVDGGMSVEDANESLGLMIPQGMYETIAGFILTRLGHIPIEGERLYNAGFLVEVIKMNGVKIEQLRVTRVAVVAHAESE